MTRPTLPLPPGPGSARAHPPPLPYPPPPLRAGETPGAAGSGDAGVGAAGTEGRQPHVSGAGGRGPWARVCPAQPGSDGWRLGHVQPAVQAGGRAPRARLGAGGGGGGGVGVGAGGDGGGGSDDGAVPPLPSLPSPVPHPLHFPYHAAPHPRPRAGVAVRSFRLTRPGPLRAPPTSRRPGRP